MTCRFHYAWTIALLGMLAVLASIGLGRFALGMLLPAMGRALDLGYAQMGYIGTANFIGYLVAVFVAGRLARRFGSRVLISAFLLLIAASMAAVASANGFATVVVFYLLTGIGSGGANVLSMALVAHWFEASHRGTGAGVVVCGSSLGIMLSGVLVPFFGNRFAADGWRASWLAMAVLTLLIAALCALMLRDRPAQIGGAALGRPADAGARGATGMARGDPRAPLWHLAAVYFLFGYTYAIYATFLVTSLVAERGFSEAAAGNLWASIGVLSLVSGPAFGALSDRHGRALGLAAAFALHTAAYLLAALATGHAAIYLSVVCFGVAAWSVPTIMAATVGDQFGAERAAAAFGTVTLVFGVGQITGPAAAGALAEASGGFTASFLIDTTTAAGAVGVRATL